MQSFQSTLIFFNVNSGSFVFNLTLACGVRRPLQTHDVQKNIEQKVGGAVR